MIMLGVERVEGDGPAVQVQAAQQGLEAGDLTAPAGHCCWFSVSHRLWMIAGDQVDRPLSGSARAAQRLSVQGHGLTGVGVLGQPGSDRFVQGIAVKAGRQPAAGAGAGHSPQAETGVRVGWESGGESG
ncbi:hypothetical protein GCM10009716_48010 [Streptomyces sodiiphilus]|uniref:Uncharacterized protein n=1 Tax=Streptomyces sodiiphilus TaxID=226217 RepID=A0ABN2PW73_9ACTN